MMKKIIVLLISLPGFFFLEANAQDKVVLDISLEDKSAYLNVSPDIFTDYQDVVENQLGATFILNEDQAIDSNMLEETDVLILLSTLNSETPNRTRSATEINAIVSFVKKGGSLVIFTDENKSIDIESFGANEIVRPFGMEFGDELPYKGNVGAISFIGDFIKDRYEISIAGVAN